ETSVQAINQGNIFRFYQKPCPAEQLREGLRAGVRQFQLVTGERELLEKTLAGSLKVLIDAVSMNDPAALARDARLRGWVRMLRSLLADSQPWQIEIAATLHAIGKLAIPPEIFAKKAAGEVLSDYERSVIDRVPEFGRNLLINIPRMDKVAEIVRLQDRGFDGSGFPPDGPTGLDIPIGARVLRILKDLNEVCGTGPLTNASFALLERHKSRYDPNLYMNVKAIILDKNATAIQYIIEIPLSALSIGQVLQTDLCLTNGHLILAANTRISEIHLERLHVLRKLCTFIEPVRVST
ncbi:MAG: hypothetical protein HQL37_04300, partial [Alphaproteobacteria bacterium]|nr:hypothetical protein [Alphaproteobacteria bacterium]